ncbi:C1 family peptidase [Pendulispora albinea]|uniref:C1 family peptidase n=1 Tax=Pendulispora albinea TaxID=2741071 RepID=A0ABZ2LWW9_9BACT
MPVLDIQTLTADLSHARARWQPRHTGHSNLSDAAKKNLLGVVVDPAALAAAMAPQASAAPNFAPAVDWRNRNGNHVTPVKDQGGCGSCVSFCTTATVESMASIEKGQRLDLSEADLHFCSSHGANCNGWWPDQAIAQVKVRGIPDEGSFPYSAAFEAPPPNPKCIVVPGRDEKAVKVTTSGTLSNVVDRKNYLTNVGPCCAVMHVFNDFFSYASGVYHHVNGADMGLHCVQVIGYSEAESCWICKNSWGSSWGNGGYFKIAYGEAGIDTEFPFWTAQGVVLPSGRGWQGWENLGGQITSKPSAVSWGPNRIDVVARGLDSAVWHRWWDGSAWRGWESLGGQIQGAPAICAWASGRLDIFAVGLDHRLYHKWYQGGWSGWESLGGTLSSDPAAVSWGPNRIDVFAKGMDQAMWHLWWDGTGWHGWESLGGGLSSAPAVSSWSANRLDTFVRGCDMHLWHKWWDGSRWSNWEDLGGVLSDGPGAESWGPNRIDVFYPGQNSHMWHKWWDGSRWSGEEDLGGTLSSGVGTSSWAEGRLDCFVEGTDSAMYHKWYVR